MIAEFLQKPLWTRSIKRRRPSRLELWIAKLIRILGLFLIVAFVIWRSVLHFQVSRRLSAVRSVGLPTSAQELERWHQQIPQGSNAATLLSIALDRQQSLPGFGDREVSDQSLLDSRERWSPSVLGQITEYVKTNLEALELARDAVSRPLCRYPVDRSLGYDAEFPHFPKLKSLARTAGLRACLSSRTGEAKEWIPDVLLILHLAGTLEQEPELISQLVRGSLISIAVTTTERCLNESPFSPLTCDLIGAFASAINSNSLPRALIGERATGIPAFRLSWAELQGLAGEKGTHAPSAKVGPLLGRPNPLIWLTGFLERDLECFLRVMETNIVFAALPPPSCFAVTNSVESGLVDGAYSSPLSHLLLPAIASTLLRDTETLARIRLVQVALEIECCRSRRGRLPASLADLSSESLPVLALDPFTGGWLKFHLTERGYVIYSVGRDGKDDGGRERPAKPNSRDSSYWDITFTVGR